MCIAYWARVGIGPFSRSFASVMEFTGGTLTTRTLPDGLAEPVVTGDQLVWSAPGVAVEMTREVPASRHSLLDDRVSWSCDLPKAAARLSSGATTFVGKGYAESLHLNVAPWRVPLRELRWGRFTGTRESVVWIDWRGGHPLTLVLHAGRRVEPAEVGDDSVSFAGLSLALTEPLLIRDETIGRTLRGVHPLSRALPRRLTDSRETKYRSRGVLSDRTGAVDRGWCIHEVVRFT